jgi:hypothetical protein
MDQQQMQKINQAAEQLTDTESAYTVAQRLRHRPLEASPA